MGGSGNSEENTEAKYTKGNKVPVKEKKLHVKGDIINSKVKLRYKSKHQETNKVKVHKHNESPQSNTRAVS